MARARSKSGPVTEGRDITARLPPRPAVRLVPGDSGTGRNCNNEISDFIAD